MANVYSHIKWSKGPPKIQEPTARAGITLLIVIISGLFSGFVAYKLAPEKSLTQLLGFCILYFITYLGLKKLYARAQTKQLSLLPGFQAMQHYSESSVLEELKKLPPHFSVYHYLELANKKPVHFLVVSTSGIFAIRVHHHPGVVGYDGTDLTHNGSEFNDTGLLFETKRQTQELEQCLRNSLGMEIPIKPILLFSRNTTVVDFIELELKGVTLLRYDHLDYYLLRHPCPLPRIDLLKLHEILLPLVHRS